MTDSKKPLLVFPCDFPIKVIGKNDPNFKQTVIDLIKLHVPDFDPDTITSHTSGHQNYIAFNVVVHVTSKEQLDEIYRTLSSSTDVIMAL